MLKTVLKYFLIKAFIRTGRLWQPNRIIFSAISLIWQPFSMIYGGFYVSFTTAYTQAM